MSSVTLKHGWPWVYIERRMDWGSEWWNPSRDDGYPPAGIYGVPWLATTAWAVGAGQRVAVSWAAALGDLAILGAWFACVAAVAEWRRNRRAHVWQVSLSELLAGLSMAAVAMGWMAWSQRVHQREQAYVSELEDPDEDYDSLVYVDKECIAPTFVQHLLGNELLPDFLWRANEAAILLFGDVAPEETAWLQRHLVKLEGITTIQLDNVEAESMPVMLAQLATLPQLRKLDFEYNYELRIDARQATCLAAIKQLREIVLPNREQLDGDAREILAQELPACTIRFIDDEAKPSTY